MYEAISAASVETKVLKWVVEWMVGAFILSVVEYETRDGH